jgi:hypothetical protein
MLRELSPKNSAPGDRDARAAGARRRPPLDDQLALSRDLVGLIWQHKLWWLVPVLLALLVLSLLLVLQATPLGPLLYPLF